MKTFHKQQDNPVKSYNDKIISNLAEYYYLDGRESMGKLKAINTKIVYLNEKYHIRIKYIAGDKKIYSRVYPREAFRDKYIFIKIENRLNPNNFKSIKFAVPLKNFYKMNEHSLLREIAHSGYINQIKEKINVDFSVKKKNFYLFENPILYPEEYCNKKYTIVDDDYIKKVFEIQQKNYEFVKNENGILPNMKVKNK